jgi:DNA-binding GntR family transcriptional regulator
LQLLPGIALDELDLVEKFRVSRTPIREALIRLASEELIVLVPNQAPRVAPLDIIGTKELFESLELAQRATTRWAALRRDAEALALMRKSADAFAKAADDHDFYRMVEANLDYHMAIANACGNRRFAKFYYGLLSSTLRLANVTLANAPIMTGRYRAYFDNIIEEHDRMIDLIRDQRADEADKLAQEHCRSFRDRVAGYIQTSFAGQLQLNEEQDAPRPTGKQSTKTKTSR